MPSIDERIVSMVFDNAKFEQGVAHTQRSLAALDASLAKVGSRNGLADIENQANKVTLQQPMSALDKLKSKFSRSGADAAQSMSEIERSGNKVQLEQPVRAVQKVNSEVAQVGRGAPQAFNEIERSASRISFQGLHAGLDSVTAKFSTLQATASVALGNIASQATMRGVNWAKGFGIGPILDGLHEYELNLKSIQTIQANTDRPLTEINHSLQELNEYSDQTIYNFSEMAKNIGTFTAAGVDLKTATSSIKGIANMAALSGSSSHQAATAMYQLSQAIASGKVGLQDWNSVVNAGMGGKKLQTALTTTAVAMGKLDGASVKLVGPLKQLKIDGKSFRESIMAKPGQESWLESDILVNTLATLDGRFSKAALSAELTKDGLKKYTAAQVEAKIADSRAALEKKNGVKYTDEQFKALMKLSDSAFKSATEVKTLGQVFQVAKETIGSGWSASFQSIFGNLKEAKKLWTGMSNVVNDFIRKGALRRNEMLAEWKDLGGRTKLIEGFKNAFKALFAILKPIGQAFRDIFPAQTGRSLFEMTKNFAAFTKSLMPGAETLENLKRTARGFFAVMHIGWNVIKGVIGVIGDLLGVAGKGGGSFLSFTGSIGDFLVAIDTALTKGGMLKSFFNTISSILAVPIRLVGSLASAFFGLFSGFDTNANDKVRGGLDNVTRAATPLGEALDTLRDAWGRAVAMFQEVKTFVTPILQDVGTAMGELWDKITEALSGGGMDSALNAMQTGFIGGIFLMFRNMFKGFGGDVGGMFEEVKNVLGALTGKLEIMQQKVRAQIILQIAAAIGILAASAFVLSGIDPEDLGKAMAAMAVGLGQLMGAMKLIMGPMGKMALAQIPIISGSLIAMAAAMIVLAGAVKIFQTMDWEELGRGLAGVGGGLAILAVAAKFMGPGLLVIGPGLLVIALALNVMAAAVKQFGSMSLADLGKGILGIAWSLTAMAIPLAALWILGPQLIVTAGAVLILSVAMSALAGAVRAFGSLPLGDLAKGIGGATLALAGLAAPMLVLSFAGPQLLLAAGAMLVTAVALNGIASAVKVMGGIGIGGLVKGLVGLAAALGILSVGLYLMIGTLPGAAALLVAAGALAVLGPALGFIGQLDLWTIIKGLVGIGAAMTGLAIAGVWLAPGLVALGMALLPLAGVLLAVSVATLAFAKAISLLAGEGTKGVGVFIAAITALVAVLPKIVIDFVKGVVEILDEIVKLLPQVVNALVKIIDAVIELVIRSAPRLGLALDALIKTAVEVLNRNAPRLIDAGWKLLLALLQGLDKNMNKVVERAGSVITKFLNGLATQAPKIMTAGTNLVVNYLRGIANNLPRVLAAAVRVATTFLMGLAQNAQKFVQAGATAIRSFLNAISRELPSIVRSGARVIVRFLEGIGRELPGIVKSAVSIITRFIRAVGREAPRIADAGFKAIIDFLHGIARAIRENDRELMDAGADILKALIEGVVEAAGRLAGPLRAAIEKLFGMLPGWAKKILGIKSPSKVFVEIGNNVIAGFSIGLQGMPGMLRQRVSTPLENMLRENKGLGEFGKYLGKEFQDGLRGGLWDDGKGPAHQQIEATFTGLRDKLKEQQDKLREQIKAGEDKLKELLNAAPEERDAKQITKVFRELGRDRQLLEQGMAASNQFMQSLQDEKVALIKLGYEYEEAAKDLELAETALVDLTRARDDAIKSYTDQYSSLPSIGTLMDQALAEAEMTAEERAEAAKKKREEKEKRAKIDQVANYKKQLQQQIADTQKYMETLKALAAAGLDDVSYKMLLGMGTAGQEFASQLLKGGAGGIEELNQLNTQLAGAAAELANNAAQEFYATGIQAAEGLVIGLKERKGEIREVMEEIAFTMVQAIQNQLGIRSPSRVFAKLGEFAALGMAKGLTTAAGVVTAAATSVAEGAAGALTDSLAGLSEQLAADVDTDLTITPVLDLKQFQKDARQMHGIANVTPITAAASYGQASVISESTTAQAEEAAREPARSVAEFRFEQNISSPKPVNEVEVYRHTRNQLSQVKSALGLTG